MGFNDGASTSDLLSLAPGDDSSSGCRCWTLGGPTPKLAGEDFLVPGDEIMEDDARLKSARTLPILG